MGKLLRLSVILLACATFGAGHLAPASAQAPTPPFKGSAKGALGPVSLHAGVVIVHARSNGTVNFVVSLVAQDPGQDIDHSFDNRCLMIDAIDRYDGAVATVLRADADYFVVVSAASGAYEITIEQPAAATIRGTDKRNFIGTNQQVLVPMLLPAGTYSFSAQSDSSVLIVRLFTLDDLGGGPATSGYDARIIDTGRDPATSVSVDLPVDGLYLISVDPQGSGTLKWSLTVQ